MQDWDAALEDLNRLKDVIESNVSRHSGHSGWGHHDVFVLLYALVTRAVGSIGEND